ncbi:MAG: hypothetical protein ACXIVF_20205 [Rhizobiaceae bacterium]
MWLSFAATIPLPLASPVPAYGVTLGWDTLTFVQHTDTMWRQALICRAFASSFTYAGSAAHAAVATSVVAAIMLLLEAASRHFPENALPWRQLCPGEERMGG